MEVLLHLIIKNVTAKNVSKKHKTMEEKISQLISFLQDRKDYYKSMIEYENKFGNTRVTDCLDARMSEIDFVFWELQRIKNNA